ncbi:MAG: High potential iron-sulfur protein [Pseudomonadales bacterium]|nr:High potential iron-sulfur protein [Pseudomonadales bacterium]
MSEKPISRRQMLKSASAGLALLPLLSLEMPKAWAAERITEDHPTASALGYYHDAADVDLAKYPKRAGDEGAKQYCYNCSQYKETEENWGTCGIFPNYLVAKDGWCNVWVPIT